MQWSMSLEDAGIPHCLDLALVVTPSHCRASVVEDLAKSHTVKAWILEKVLAQSCSQLDQIEQTLCSYNQVWVNTPMHNGLASGNSQANSTEGSVPLQVKVSGGSWALLVMLYIIWIWLPGGLRLQ